MGERKRLFRIKIKNNMKDQLKKGDKVYCILDLIMNGTGFKAATKGNYYDVIDISLNRFEFIDNENTNHGIEFSDNPWFIIQDPVNKPSHYTQGKIEVIDFIEDQNLCFHLANTVKYISRAGKKDPNKEIEDLEKAKWYLQRKIDNLKKVN